MSRRLRVTERLRQNARGFYLCEAFSTRGKLCASEASWVRQLFGGPVYLCEDHNNGADSTPAHSAVGTSRTAQEAT